MPAPPDGAPWFRLGIVPRHGRVEIAEEGPVFPFMSKRGAASLQRRQAAQVKKTLKAATRAAQGAIRQADKTAKAVVRDVVQDAAREVGRTIAQASRPAPKPVRRSPAGRFVTVDGLPVHVVVKGRGRPVVLIHGNGTMAEDFAISGLIDRLATRYRVIALDRPGFGRTERPRARIWTAAAQGALIHRVLDALNAERPLIVGHSWGTIVALAMAAEPRRPLRGLVLLSGYYFPENRADVTLAGPLAVPGLGDAARALVPDRMNRALAEQSFRKVFWPQAVPAKFSERFPVEVAVASQQLRAVSEDAASMNAAVSRLQAGYGRLGLPVAILTGDADGLVDHRTQSMRLHGVLPDSTIAVLPGLGHMIHHAGRAKVEAAIDALMARGLPRVEG
ncbi:pimeloyl-ACP methyl ester carboxylesterase [Methylorubrum rhodinum]|uniref:Pimeloyl-ACP methyl ester carboxylesterase n=1 Tax=Methylorubrum rhodinum TaxID=29428 RepID=A0A840ZU95_9HYPH|nr:alpha/beta hydrolase [Methylorubrum rhodinum]MBB5760203.1 pimeloyl-ACP methyl ester carboxylesterase [Methylorubrum rhodinum]